MSVVSEAEIRDIVAAVLAELSPQAVPPEPLAPTSRPLPQQQ